MSIDPGVDPTARPKSVSRMMIILVALYAVAFLDRQIIAMIAPDLRADMQLSATQLALLQGFAFVLFYTIAGLPIGALVDRISRRAIIFTGVIVWSLSASAGGLTSTFSQLLITRFGVGAGEAALAPSAYSMIADSVPRSKLGLMASIFAGGASIGAAISVAVGGLLMAWAVAQDQIDLPLIGILRPWQFVLLAVGLPGVLLAGLIFLIAEPARLDRIDQSQVGLRHLLTFIGERRAFFLCCYGGFAFWQVMINSFSLWVPTRLVRDYHWTYDEVGMLLAGGAFISVLGGVVIGRTADHLVRRGRVAGPLIVSATCAAISGTCVMLAFASQTALMFTSLLVIATTPSILIGMGSTAVQMIAPNEYRGRLIALYTFTTTLAGAGLGPLLPALLADKVFRSEASINEGVIITVAMATPLAVLLLLCARGPMRRAYAAAAAWRTEA